MAITVTSKTPAPSAKTGPPRRNIGRPSGSEPGVGRDALITATCELLAKAPAEHVTRALVARTMNVDPSLIRYYFRDRSSLLAAAAERISQEYVSLLEERMAESDGSATSRMSIRLGSLIDFNARYPFFHNLLFTEMLHSESPAAKQMVENLNRRAVGGYAEILSDGLKTGELREADPQLVFMALMTMSSFFTPLMDLLGLHKTKDFDAAGFTERYKAFLLDFIVNGLGRHTDRAV